jgi:integrase
MNKKLKSVPKFKSEADERRFWETHDSSNYVDWNKAERVAVASPGLTMAALLALWTGQRQGDLLRLPWSAYDGKYIRLRQSKTGRRVTIAPTSQQKCSSIRPATSALALSHSAPASPCDSRANRTEHRRRWRASQNKTANPYVFVIAI